VPQYSPKLIIAGTEASVMNAIWD